MGTGTGAADGGGSCLLTRCEPSFPSSRLVELAGRTDESGVFSARTVQQAADTLRRFPDHAPSLLQKTGALRQLGRWQDLREFLEEQVSKKGGDPVFASELGEVLKDRGKMKEAARSFREAIRLDIDHTNPCWRLVQISTNLSEKLEAVRFVESEMRRQVSHGEIVLAYQSMARSLIDPPVLLSQLQEFCSERPENVHTARQLMDLQMKDGEFDAAGITFDRLRHYASGPYIVCDGIELALKKRDIAGALADTEQFLSDPDADEALFGHVAHLYESDGASSEWAQWIKQKTKAGTHAAPGSLVAFLRTLPAGKMIRSARKWMKREPEGSEARIAAWDFLIHFVNRFATDRD